MRWLVDSNVLLRSAQPSHPMYGDVARSISILTNRVEELHVVAQNLIELWVVATRPLIGNGLELTVAQTQRELTKLKTIFTILPETADILPKWEQLIVKHQVLGKQAHDARLVAAMSVHNLTHLLTFNDRDFKRFSEITVLNPQDVN